MIVKYFANDQDVKKAAHAWLVTQSKTFVLRAYRSFGTAGLNVLIWEGTTQKNDATVHAHCNHIT
jgi:hypothetical protein